MTFRSASLWSIIALNHPPAQLSHPFYEGSVQRLFDLPDDPALMVTQTTDRGSVFDVGALFEIPGQDVNRAVFRHVLYSKMGDTIIWNDVADSIKKDSTLDESFRSDLLKGPLEEFTSIGALTHHIGMLDAKTGELVAGEIPDDPSAYNVVRKFKILKPSRVDVPGGSLFDYSVFPGDTGFVVPLEFIVRFGMTSASSVYRKYLTLDRATQRTFANELGTEAPLEPWKYLPQPITDLTTKFEPSDRMLSKQEALVTSGLRGRRFAVGLKMAVLGARAVRTIVEKLGLCLWDIKWELAKDGDQLVFVDTIDTDSFRATLTLDFEDQQFACHFNKQAIRDYYQLFHPDWIAAISQAKEKGNRKGVDFTEILEARQKAGESPENPPVDPDFIEIQGRKMTTIRDFMLDRIEAEAATSELKKTGLDELSFYKKSGMLEQLHSINGIS